jgi:antitoxin (DNA-binding transcriptional repressor) of toxin-antitoxin stability system
LRRKDDRSIFSNISTISLSDLKEKPASQLLQAAGKEDLIVTSDGQPVALILRIAPQSLEATQSFVRSVRALQAQAALQEAADANGTSNLSPSDIDAEIAAARKARRK